MPLTLSDRILTAIEPVDAMLFELVATGPNVPAHADVAAYEVSLGFPLPDYFRELVLGPLGGLYVRARETAWPHPEIFDVVEAGYFLRGIAILGMATDNPIERLDLRFALQRVQGEGIRDFAPALVLDGDNGVYGFDPSGGIRFEVDGSISESDEQDFAELYAREIAGLIQRQARYGRSLSIGSSLTYPETMSRGRSIAAAIAVAIGAILYGISPIDVIPELLTGPLGFADDLAVWVGAGFAIWKLLTGGRQNPGGVNPPPTPPPAQ